MEKNSCNNSLRLLYNCHNLNIETTFDLALGKPMRNTAGACACDMAVKSGPFSDVPDLHWTGRVATCLHKSGNFYNDGIPNHWFSCSHSDKSFGMTFGVPHFKKPPSKCATLTAVP